MPTVACPACDHVNSLDSTACSHCGASLEAARLEQSIAQLKQTSEKLKDLTTPRKNFYSINGCGTMLLDYRRRGDGTFEAVRWVTIFFLPIIPLIVAYLLGRRFR